MNARQNKHLVLDERIVILEELKRGSKLVTISKKIGNDPTTISKEIKLHRYSKPGSNYAGGSGSGYLCKKTETCKINSLCKSNCLKNHCKLCCLVNCTTKCAEFEPSECIRITRYPYTCHGCPKVGSCRRLHYYYDPKLADSEYHKNLVDSRTGVNQTKEDFKKLDEIVREGVERGLSIYAICQFNPELHVSERTIYRWINDRILTTVPLSLRRMVTYKKRSKGKPITKKEAACRDNRLFTDYLLYLAENPSVKPVQLDLVIGKNSDNQLLMTLHFPLPNFMLGFLIENKKPESVAKVFNEIQDNIGIDAFNLLFPVILTDRGSEFYQPENIEFDHDSGMRRTKVFYCDPQQSTQKSEMEKNHTFIRYFVPKNKTMNNLTQEKVNLMFSHINSYPREARNDYTPYDAFAVIYGSKIATKLKITSIEPSDLIMTQALIK